MKNERLARILGLIDEDIIAESDERKAKRKHFFKIADFQSILLLTNNKPMYLKLSS